MFEECLPWLFAHITAGGHGFVTRTRLCTGGTCGNCEGGAAAEYEACTVGVLLTLSHSLGFILEGNIKHWSDWSVWGGCSVCGFGGTQYRIRSCEGDCGEECVGSNLGTQACNGGLSIAAQL